MATLDPGVTGRRRRGAARKTAQPQKAHAPLTKAAATNAATATEKPRKTFEPPAGSPFMTIPSYGKKFYGLSKNGSYDAAERGDFGKLILIGRRKFVAVASAEANAKAATEAAE